MGAPISQDRFPTCYNNTIAGLRHVLDIGIQSGIIYGNTIWERLLSLSAGLSSV